MLRYSVSAHPRVHSVHAFSSSPQPVSGTGLLSVIRNDVPYQEMPLNIVFQANAFRGKLRKQ